MKHLAADIVLIWKDIIVGESLNDPQTTNNNNNNSFSVEFDKISQVSRKTTMMKQIDPNIDIEESEDSSSNHMSSVHHSPIVPTSYGISKPMSTNTMNSPGNVFEKLKPTDSFSLAISSADKSLSDSNKRPKTTKSYPSKFRSGELVSNSEIFGIMCKIIKHILCAVNIFINVAFLFNFYSYSSVLLRQTERTVESSSSCYCIFVLMLLIRIFFSLKTNSVHLQQKMVLI